VRATEILTQHRAVLDHVASELLEREVLEGDEVYEIIREMTGRELKPMRVRLREAKDREARKNQAAAARSKKSAKSGDATGERADRETDGYPGSPEPAPAQFSAFSPRPHPTTDEA
jgi:cell division protease FtsH